MNVQDIMTKEVITVPSDGPIDLVANILVEHRIHGVPVVDGEKLVGIITETDFFTKDSLYFNLSSYLDFIRRNKTTGEMTKQQKDHIISLINSTAKDIMSDKCVTICQEDKIEKLVETFRETRLKSIPVVDEAGILRGIITRSDVIKIIRL